jgi:hypothetical protein
VKNFKSLTPTALTECIGAFYSGIQVLIKKYVIKMCALSTPRWHKSGVEVEPNSFSGTSTLDGEQFNLMP